MNANLATIKVVDPAHPNGPAELKYLGHGVESNVIITGVAGTTSQAPSSIGYGIPALSLILDVWVLRGSGNDMLVSSNIAFPFSAGTTQSHAITKTSEPPDLISAISRYVIDQVEIGALIAAVNAMGQQFTQSPFAVIRVEDQLFPLFDKAMRTSVGDEINKAIVDLKLPISLKIGTGDLMSPFLVFDIAGFNLQQRTVDIRFTAVGFSTMLSVLDQSGQLQFGTALSLVATGQGHLSKDGLDMKLDYKINGGWGLGAIAPKYVAQISDVQIPINGALIPKLEAVVKQLLTSQLDSMLFVLNFLPTGKSASKLQPLPEPQPHYEFSPTRRTTSKVADAAVTRE